MVCLLCNYLFETREENALLGQSVNKKREFLSRVPVATEAAGTPGNINIVE